MGATRVAGFSFCFFAFGGVGFWAAQRVAAPQKHRLGVDSIRASQFYSRPTSIAANCAELRVSA